MMPLIQKFQVHNNEDILSTLQLSFPYEINGADPAAIDKYPEYKVQQNTSEVDSFSTASSVGIHALSICLAHYHPVLV